MWLALSSKNTREGLKFFEPFSKVTAGEKSKTKNQKSDSIFLVHGHDNESKQEVARFLEHLRLRVQILHEQENSGMTIIEKLEKFSDVASAVILLTPDDRFSEKDSKKFRFRARQNVILELGYFTGMLGRKRVHVLVKKGVELPSDINGIVYTEFDDHGGWKRILAKELRENGLRIDPKRLLA